MVAVSTDATPLLSNSNEAAVSFAGALNVYNIITPNGDGKNDVLVIDNIQLYPGNTLTIYNRWGREVYKTTNYQQQLGHRPRHRPRQLLLPPHRAQRPQPQNLVRGHQIDHGLARVFSDFTDFVAEVVPSLPKKACLSASLFLCA